MIDFRYHIVSLISVFLALAVGIILGAGPLKESIGDSLTGQVDSLRADKDTLRTQLDAARADQLATDAYIGAAAPELLRGLMPGTRVGIIQIGAVDDALFAGVETQIKAAGAEVSVRTQLTPMWTNPNQADSRQSFAANLSAYLPDPTAQAGFDAVLAEALMVSLTETDPANADAFSSDASLVQKILVEGKLIEMPADPVAPADVIVILALTTGTSAVDNADTIKARAAESVIELKVVNAAQEMSDGVVVAGATPLEGDLVSTIRSEKIAAGSTTVLQVDAITGQVNVPLALAARVKGTVGQYGIGPDSTAPIPPRMPLDAPVRVPDAANPPAADAAVPPAGDAAVPPEGTGGTVG